jgi:hypothetical protein
MFYLITSLYSKTLPSLRAISYVSRNTDVLDYIIGAELLQKQLDKKLRLVAFFLKKFLNTELNYEIYNKELLAIIRAIKE